MSHLEWKDVFLAFRADELVGVLAAWDQRAFRRWQVTGYAPWLRCVAGPVEPCGRAARNAASAEDLAPSLDYFILSLACIRQNDRSVFNTLLETILREKRTQYSFFLAGLHERDPLLPELLARPHVPLPSRLYVVAWEDGAEAVRKTGSAASSLFGAGSALMKLESQTIAVSELAPGVGGADAPTDAGAL